MTRRMAAITTLFLLPVTTRAQDPATRPVWRRAMSIQRDAHAERL